MRTKRGYAEQLIKMMYPNATNEAKITLAEAALVLGQARDYFIKAGLFENMQLDGAYINADWLSVYENVQVAYDEERCRGYLYLPTRVLSLPNNLGVYEVKPCGADRAYVPITPTYGTMFGTSAVKELEGIGSYYLLQDRLIFPTQTPPKKVDLLLVSLSEDIGDDEYFPIPSTKEPLIYELAIKQLSLHRQAPEDTTINNQSE